MNGSRANPNAPKDILQDFDIVYAVTDIGPFRKNPGWIARFGKPLMVLEPDSQMPDAASARPDEKYTWLMLFEDGNRIDLTLRRVDTAAGHAAASRQTVVLLDKDHILPDLPPASDADYHVARPDPDTFCQCCESFWWDATYVAKGLWRREILYAMDHLNQIVRPSLIDMLTWTAGLETAFGHLPAGRTRIRLARPLHRRRTFPRRRPARRLPAGLFLQPAAGHRHRAVHLENPGKPARPLKSGHPKRANRTKRPSGMKNAFTRNSHGQTGHHPVPSPGNAPPAGTRKTDEETPPDQRVVTEPSVAGGTALPVRRFFQRTKKKAHMAVKARASAYETVAERASVSGAMNR